MPTATASDSALQRCARARLASPEIHLASPRRVAIRPSTVCAYLSTTYGRHEGAAARPRSGATSVASATDLHLAPASLGGVLGWWSLFNLPREALPGVLRTFAEALVPGGQALVGTHVGDGDIARTEGYGGLPVCWTTHLYRPEELARMLLDAGLEVIAELRLPAQPPSLRAQVLHAARRPA